MAFLAQPLCCVVFELASFPLSEDLCLELSFTLSLYISLWPHACFLRLVGDASASQCPEAGICERQELIWQAYLVNLLRQNGHLSIYS